jgi:hypothetical protein
MPYSSGHNPNNWGQRAAEARARAATLTSAGARRYMLACAQAYDRLAKLAENHPIYVRPKED